MMVSFHRQFRNHRTVYRAGLEKDCLRKIKHNGPKILRKDG